MHRLRTIWWWMTVPALAAVWWLSIQGTALAQAGQPDGSTSSGGRNQYLMSYAVVILGILLGVLFVCNSSRRRDRAKPEAYGE